ncbi:MAG TPA: C4-type zinc ribbon domain-containing protein [Ignavibacteriaceae bacterium]|nr:C4-type zinc ribbon domain-containing protein [Ignavibacteriaceae bacterium]
MDKLVNRLKTLYELQLIDDQLDELEELRGDLPNAVQALKDKIDSIQEQITEKDRKRKESLEKREMNDEEVEKLKVNQKKFKSQLYQVRNNKEYDALTKEIDHTDEQIKKLETENDVLADQSKTLADDIEALSPQLGELNEELKVKEADLKEIIKANQKEEAKLRAERKEIEAQTKKPDYSAYMRIRRAKKGKAVATIKRAACSGCHNIVPSQRQLEIRRNNRLFYCEYCGRILVSPEIAELAEE